MKTAITATTTPGAISVVELAKAIMTTKLISASAIDGKVVGCDVVSDDEGYFQESPSVGTVYETKLGETRIIVDALAYPEHVADSGTVYEDAICFIAVSFDPNTLMTTGNRANVRFDRMEEHIAEGRVLSIDCASYVVDRMEELEVERLEALEAQKALEAEAQEEESAYRHESVVLLLTM